jgi:hypothetical protein
MEQGKDISALANTPRTETSKTHDALSRFYKNIILPTVLGGIVLPYAAICSFSGCTGDEAYRRINEASTNRVINVNAPTDVLFEGFKDELKGPRDTITYNFYLYESFIRKVKALNKGNIRFNGIDRNGHAIYDLNNPKLGMNVPDINGDGKFAGYEGTPVKTGKK